MSNPIKPADPQQRVMQKLQTLIETDPQLAALVPIESVGESICAPGQSLDQAMDKAFDGYADRPALGSRDYDIAHPTETKKRTRSYKPSFKTITYAQLQKRIHNVANAWTSHPTHGVKPDERVCIFGFTSAEFAILDFSTAYVHAITVPMQVGAAHTDIDAVFASIRPVTVAVTASELASLSQKVAGKDYIRSLVVFDYDDRDDHDREQFKNARAHLAAGASDVQLISLQDLESFGGTTEWVALKAHPEGPARTASIVHSSGSTGKAKAALVSEKAIQYYWVSIVKDAPPIISLALAPLSHLLGKGTLVSVLKQGGTAYFTLAPDLSTLFDDIRIARPTFVGFFPRIIELIYQHYQNEVARYARENSASEEVAREQVKHAMRGHYLGDRLCFSLFGGSQMSSAVKEFFTDCFDALLTDAYGNTEGGQVAVNGLIQRPPVIDYKLRDVPELGYYATDKPFPRGELCFKSIQTISGYYNAPEATEKLFDEDGFICTGDIVEEYEPDHIAIIDRRNDVLKLSQGEYVAVGVLGSIFEGGSDLIGQIYVYGHSQRSYLLAVIVPDEASVTAHLGPDPDDEALDSLLRHELHRVAKQEGIRSFEVPKDFIIEHEPFSEANGLLSGLRKRARPALERKYGPRLEGLYESLEYKKSEKRSKLMDPNSTLTVLEKLLGLLEVDLNIKVVDSAMPSSFHELGGDSLGAVSLSRSIEEVFQVDMQADLILSPTGNLKKWTEYIQQASSGENTRPTCASVHGKNVVEINRHALSLTNFIEADILESAKALPSPPAESSTVLLTGANGFLGRFVCLAWLEKLAPKGGKLICLVRARDNASAKMRLDRAYVGLDSKMAQRFDELARDHLDIFAGDVAEAEMGLDPADYQRLSREVDRVVHVAALVNHRLSYANLFGANVGGTAEIIRFSLAARKKAVDFVSTVAVHPLLGASQVSTEDAPLLDRVELSDAYAAGYGTSKWAGEQLLQQAHQHYALPVNVFRGDMMLAHQIYKGQINTADMFTRLLYSLIHTGLAPHSFFPLKQDGTKTSGHYDGLPVDVVAAAVVGADSTENEYRTYNLENYHRNDDCSLDRFVDWIEAAGYPMTRIKGYQEWFSSFKKAHSLLSDEQQSHSAMEILDAFALPQSEKAGAVPCDRFKRLIEDLPVGPEVPHLSQSYINKCLQDMRLLDLIEPAADQSLLFQGGQNDD